MSGCACNVSGSIERAAAEGPRFVVGALSSSLLYTLFLRAVILMVPPEMVMRRLYYLVLRPGAAIEMSLHRSVRTAVKTLRPVICYIEITGINVIGPPSSNDPLLRRPAFFHPDNGNVGFLLFPAMPEGTLYGSEAVNKYML